MSEPPAKKQKTSVAAVAPQPQPIDRTILEYMRTQNRPYSLINIYDNLHAAVPKPQMQAAIDRLLADGKLIVKEYGAQKFFFCPQDSFGDCSSAATAELEVEISDLKKSLSEISQKTSAILSDCPVSDVELEEAFAAANASKRELELAVEQIQTRIDEYAKRNNGVAEFDAAIAKFGRVLEDCNRRRKIVKSMLAFLADQLGVTPSHLTEDLGLVLLSCCVLYCENKQAPD